MVFSSLLLILKYSIHFPLFRVSRRVHVVDVNVVGIMRGYGKQVRCRSLPALVSKRVVRCTATYFFFSIFFRGEEEKKKKNPNSASWNVESAQRRLVKRVDARRKTSFDIQHGWLICPCWLYAMALTPNGSVRVLARHARPLLIGVHSDYTQAQYT